MRIEDTNFHLSDVVHKFNDSNKRTFNYAKCFIDRKKINVYVVEVLVNINCIIPSLDIITGFIHSSIENFRNDEINSKINLYKGIILKVNTLEELNLLMSILDEKSTEYNFNYEKLEKLHYFKSQEDEVESYNIMVAMK